MLFEQLYHTPRGFSDLHLCSDGEVLTAVYFEGTHHAERQKESRTEQSAVPVLLETARWLDLYFSGKTPDFMPAYRIDSQTPFRQTVTEILLRIPYGETVTYGEIAAELARSRGIARMSAQAIGGAVGANPICILIPCHRVIGAGGKLTGYSGGLENKKALLGLERAVPSGWRS